MPMSFESRIELIRMNFKAGAYSIAARECTTIIESALRELFRRYLKELSTEDRMKVRGAENLIGGGTKSFEDFGLGQLVGTFIKSNFLDAWESASGKALSGIRMINLNEVNSLRVGLEHKNWEASRSEATALFNCAEAFLQALGAISDDQDTVPNLKHDVFLSYAHVDDEPAPACTEGWVTTLIRNLQWRVAQHCSRQDAFTVWMDPNLARHVDLTPQILSILRDSAVLMVILSPAYVASDWCQREREIFLKEVKRRVNEGSGVIIVERDFVALEERPAEFSNLIGYNFWEARDGGAPGILGYPHPTNAYFDKLDDLARGLRKELVRLEQKSSEWAPPSSNGTEKSAIFLAEVTDDLDTLRDQVKRYLDQQGLSVLPSAWYPREAQRFQEAADRDLSLCTVFVQLLGPVRGKNFPGSSISYVALQHRRAMAMGKSILQWRDPGLQLNSIEDSDYRTLLGGEKVQAVDLETFKQEILRHAKNANERRPRPEGQPFVFVNIEREDLPIAENLYEVLQRHGCAYAIPMHEGTARAVRKDLEANLLDCDGLIVVYGQIPQKWVREQLRLWQKMLFRREKKLRALAVYEGPPECEHPVGMNMPELHVIDCRKGLDVHRLEPFLQALTNEKVATNA